MPEHFLASTEHQCKMFECRVCFKVTYLKFVMNRFCVFKFPIVLQLRYLVKLSYIRHLLDFSEIRDINIFLVRTMSSLMRKECFCPPKVTAKLTEETCSDTFRMCIPVLKLLPNKDFGHFLDWISLSWTIYLFIFDQHMEMGSESGGGFL